MTLLHRTFRPGLPWAYALTRWQNTSAPALSKVSPNTLVSDAVIAKLTANPIRALTLSDLVKYGKPPLSAQALYDNANFALSILPSRLAHRIRSLRSLPYIVVTNPYISQIHNNYMDSLSALLPLAENGINDQQNENEFTGVMSGLVQTHANTIPILARGFLESRKYISSEAVTLFLDEHLRARIGTRLVAEQQIALHYSSQPVLQEMTGSTVPPEGPSTYIGIIDTALKPATIIRSCESFVADICEFKYGVRPTVVINGEPDAIIAHIPVHLEYIMTELLKNAFRATIEKGQDREAIEVTIAPRPNDALASTQGINPVDQGETSKVSAEAEPLQKSTSGITIRIRDRGGGISPANLANIWNYSFTTFDEYETMDSTGTVDALNILSNTGTGESSIAGLGYGLPLGRAYAEYFGGGIAVQSLYGYGTDVYLSLRGVGNV